MKKFMLKGMAALCVCAAFASCSHDTDFEAANQELVVENLKNEYKANFIKRYGEIDPNQSWDFTNQGIVTRALTEQQGVGPNFFSYCLIDYKAIKELTDGSINAQATSSSKSYEYTLNKVKYNVTATASNITFNRYFTAILTPSFIRVDGRTNTGTIKKRYYHLFFENTEMIPNTNGKYYSSEYWYGKTSPSYGLITDRSSVINTSVGAGDWYAYYTDNTGDGTAHHNTTPVTKVREYKVIATTKNGDKFERTYWGFDCDGAENGKVDLICLVEDYKDPNPIIKRYMIEDLGDTNDTDFNDVVVDFKDDLLGHQTATIRAMGGTLDFTLKVAGKAVWTKSVDGPKLTPAINEKDMVNTGLDEIFFSKEIAVIPVTGWNPSTNNVSITVKYSVDDSKSNNTIYYEYDIPFPEVGQVPMMFATDIKVPWMVERENFPEWWLNVYSKQTEE